MFFFNKRKIANEIKMMIEFILQQPFIGTNYFINNIFTPPKGFFDDEYILGFIQGMESTIFSIRHPRASAQKRTDVSLMVLELIRQDPILSMQTFTKIANLSINGNQQNLFFKGFDDASKAVAVAHGIKLNDPEDTLYQRAVKISPKVVNEQETEIGIISAHMIMLTYNKHVKESYTGQDRQ